MARKKKGSDEPTNEDRVEWATQALEAFTNAKGERGGDPDDIRDLITDLRHYCAANGLDFQAHLANSRDNFNTEATEYVKPKQDGDKRYSVALKIGWNDEFWTLYDHEDKRYMSEEDDDYKYNDRDSAQAGADDANHEEEMDE